jgi:MerR family transcriptional regulator, redox-sensitive transcriptional activator SoxR
MPALDTEITIGDLARRSGVATSALRFYESRGLIASARTSGGQRRFARPTLRRVAFIQAAQRVGLSLDEIATALRTLPERRTPTKADWAVLSRSWGALLRSRIEELETLQTRLTSCIGCGCLSLKTCGLLNLDDRAGSRGSGARYLLGDSPDEED